MKISDDGLALVMAFEGCHREVPGRPGCYRAYKDPVGVLTIGFGHTNHHPPKFTANDIWSRAECERVLRQDMERFEQAVLKLVRVPLAQHQFDALVSFAYNCGEGNLAKSTLLKKVNARDFDGAAAEFAKWNRAGGRVLAGLTRRRRAESRLFAGAVQEAMTIAGAKRSPSKPAEKPAIPPPTPAPVPPPDVQPAEPVARESWIARLFRLLFRGGTQP